MEATQKEIATILPPKPQYVVDTSEFEDVKARLAALENRRRVGSGKENVPSLRRSVSSGSSSSSNEEQPPKLQRRD